MPGKFRHSSSFVPVIPAWIATLKKAQKSPEKYRDLVVRIGGYSDYFVRLSPEMQAEVILRTAHNI